MAEIKLSKGYVTLVDDADVELLAAHTWWVAVRRNGSAYAFTTVNKKTVLMHRFILDAPKGSFVDHKNRNTLDNRREKNLRFATKAQNTANLKRSNNSGFKGVRVGKRALGAVRYSAMAYKSGRDFSGPWRVSAEDAARDYDVLAREIHGEFAFQNFPERGQS